MNNSYTLSVSALVLALAGCGGSPSSDAVSTPTNPATPETPTPTPSTPTVAVSALQGVWRSPSGAASTVSAVALPDGKVWALISNASSIRLLKASFALQNNSLAGAGKSFTLGTSTTSTVSAISMSSSVVEKSSLNGAITTAGISEPYSLAYQSRYDTPASLGDFAGTWSATLGPGTVNWRIDTAGALSGTRTTGCTYTGQLSLRAELKAVVDAVVTETCAGAVTQLSGVAIKDEDKLGFTLLTTNADESAAVAVNLR